MKKLIVVTGPTAVGKTALCINLAERFGIPIINADSRQIYKELKIGVAAPTEEQMRRVKHYFVGTLNIDDYYSASMYEQDVMQLLQHDDNEYSLMSGGSMMYIDAVCNGIDDIPTITPETRQNVKMLHSERGLDFIRQELQNLDPQYYDIVDRNNTRRLVHALEICYQTGKTYTSFRKNQKTERPFKVIKIILNRDRQELFARINQRVDEMMRDGLLQEVERMKEHSHHNSLNTVGYKELFGYLDGQYSLNEAVEKIKTNTRRYAKKQIAWYKRDENALWFHPDDIDNILNYISHYE